MKVPRARVQRAQPITAIGESLRDQVGDAIDMLPSTLHDQQAGFKQGPSLCIGDVIPHHYIHQALLVFKGQEDDAAGCLGLLSGDHQACDPYPAVVQCCSQTFRVRATRLLQSRANLSQRMLAQAQAKAGIVGQCVLGLRGRWQGHVVFLWAAMTEQG